MKIRIQKIEIIRFVCPRCSVFLGKFPPIECPRCKEKLEPSPITAGTAQLMVLDS